MKFGYGKIGMFTIGEKSYDLTEEPSTIGSGAGFAHAEAIDEAGDRYTAFFKVDSLSGLVPWNVEKK